MKSYLEVSKELFERRDRYLLEKARRRRQIITGASVLVAAALLFLFLRISAPSRVSSPNPGDVNSPAGSAHEEEASKETTKEGMLENGDDPDYGVSEEVLRWNEITGETNADYDPKTKEEDAVRVRISEFYGKVFPEVPTDLSLQAEEERLLLETSDGIDGEVTVYRREKTGEIYWSQQEFFYSDPTGTRSLKIAVARGGLPMDCVVLSDDETMVSRMEGTEVKLFQGKDRFVALFLRENTGFRIRSRGLGEEEFLNAVRALLVP